MKEVAAMLHISPNDSDDSVTPARDSVSSNCYDTLPASVGDGSERSESSLEIVNE
jgi:hypothetical protein